MAGRMMTATELLPNLKGVKKSGDGWIARCPSHHPDKKPSLSIAERDGRLLLNCHANRGCTFESILAAVPCSNGNGAERIVKTYDYFDKDGNLIFQTVRYDPKDFRQRRLDDKGNWVWNLKDTERVLYRLPLVLAADAKEEVFICEGEKDADRLISHGLIATTCAMGAGKWRQEYNQTLHKRNAVILPDNDEAGQKHAQQVATSLYGIAASVKIIPLPGLPVNGGDVSDWLNAGNDIDALAALVEAAPEFLKGEDTPAKNERFKTFTACELLAREFSEPKEIIPSILYEGSNLLSAPPKAGKTFFSLGLALTVASGGRALGKIEVEQGDVLGLFLEDGDRRLQRRLRTMLNGDSSPERLTLATEWPRVDEGGIEGIREWIAKAKKPLFVVCDTLKRIRPREYGSRRLYDLDYDSVSGLTDLAHEVGIAILIVHHTRKMQSNDHLEMASGSLGLTGAVDAVLSLKRARGEPDACLSISGRDCEDTELALKWDGQLVQWNVLGNAAEYNKSKARREITNLLKESDKALTPKEVARLLPKEYSATKKLMWTMAEDGDLKVANGRYSLPSNSGNQGNLVTTNGD